jgi:hypothetical protein
MIDLSTWLPPWITPVCDEQNGDADMARTRDNGAAVADFIERKRDIDTMLGRLQRLSADHFHADPDRITWGDVGTVSHYAELLKRITDCAFHEGEFAD